MNKRYLLPLLLLLLSLPCMGQADRKDVRQGNRRFKKEDYKNSEIDYRKALVKDSTSFAAAYDLASALYRQNDYEGAASALEPLKEEAKSSSNGDRYYFNQGDIALKKKDYSAAVDAFKQSLLRNPSDMEAKENYAYAVLMQEKSRQDGGGDNQDRNQDQDQNQQDQDQNQNQNQQNQNQDQDQNRQDQDRNNGQQPQQQSISPQQAKQMLSAMQAKEKDTQEKVEKAKAAALKSRQKEKNW